jgi:hypothetical protein
LLGLAIILVAAWFLRFQFATEQVLTPYRNVFYDSVQRPLLPRDLAILTMLAATGISHRRTVPARAVQWRQTVYVMLAAAVVLAGLMAYEADRTFITFLIYLAVTGVELYQPPRLMPPEFNVSNSVRVHRFTQASFAGLALLMLNLLLIAGLAKWWNQRRWRWVLLMLLAGGLGAETWFSSQIVFRGVRPLSPAMADGIVISPVAVIVVALMILLAGKAVLWSSQIHPISRDPSIGTEHRYCFFHESCLGSLSLGVCAATAVIGQWINDFREVLPIYKSKSLDFQLLVNILTLHPATGIGLAATIGGLALAWIRRRKRDELLADLLPEINPSPFFVTLSSLMIAVIAGAPILAAASFSFWFVRFGRAFL